MENIQEKTFNEYKRLDALLKDMYSARESGVNEYLIEMKLVSSKVVVSNIPNWFTTYQSLTRIRNKKNMHTNETSASDATAFTERDYKWLVNFYNDLISSQDALSLYEQELQKQKEKARNVDRRFEERSRESKPLHEVYDEIKASFAEAQNSEEEAPAEGAASDNKAPADALELSENVASAATEEAIETVEEAEAHKTEIEETEINDDSSIEEETATETCDEEDSIDTCEEESYEEPRELTKKELKQLKKDNKVRERLAKKDAKLLKKQEKKDAKANKKANRADSKKKNSVKPEKQKKESWRKRGILDRITSIVTVFVVLVLIVFIAALGYLMFRFFKG